MLERNTAGISSWGLELPRLSTSPQISLFNSFFDCCPVFLPHPVCTRARSPCLLPPGPSPSLCNSRLRLPVFPRAWTGITFYMWRGWSLPAAVFPILGHELLHPRLLPICATSCNSLVHCTNTVFSLCQAGKKAGEHYPRSHSFCWEGSRKWGCDVVRKEIQLIYNGHKAFVNCKVQITDVHVLQVFIMTPFLICILLLLNSWCFGLLSITATYSVLF